MSPQVIGDLGEVLQRAETIVGAADLCYLGASEFQKSPLEI